MKSIYLLNVTSNNGTDVHTLYFNDKKLAGQMCNLLLELVDEKGHKDIKVECIEVPITKRKSIANAFLTPLEIKLPKEDLIKIQDAFNKIQ